MSDRPPAPPRGLCDRCRYQRLVPNSRGSVFSLCERARQQPAEYPRYPRLPVLSCPGFEARETETGEGEGREPGAAP